MFAQLLATLVLVGLLFAVLYFTLGKFLFSIFVKKEPVPEPTPDPTLKQELLDKREELVTKKARITNLREIRNIEKAIATIDKHLSQL